MQRSIAGRRRIAAVALVVAVLIGCVSGGYAGYAYHRAQNDPLAAGPSSPQQPPGDQGTPQPFYFADGTIHDGGRQVEVQLSREMPVSSLQRSGDGWLLVQLQSEGGDQEEYYATYVYPDGSSWELGGIGQNWDIDPDGRVLFTPEPWEWQRADPSSHKLTSLEIVEGPGDDPGYMQDGEPAPWMLWGEGGVVTGWEGQGPARMALTETDGYTHTETGPRGVIRPNTAPDGRLAVGSVPADGPSDGPDPAHCLTGGELGSRDWWQNCDHKRLSYSSPYAPDGSKLLVVDLQFERSGPGSFTSLDAETGAVTARVDAPEGTYDAAWADNGSLLVLARDDDSEQTRIHRLGLDGTQKLIIRASGDAVLGDP